VGGGVIVDLFESSERGFAIAIFALGPLLGPVVGPICGGILSEQAGWRWVSGLTNPIGITSLTSPGILATPNSFRGHLGDSRHIQQRNKPGDNSGAHDRSWRGN
jgi:MFS family permease